MSEVWNFKNPRIESLIYSDTVSKHLSSIGLSLERRVKL